MFRPKVGKGVVILVKHGVVGMHPVIGSRLALTVHAHPKGGVGEDCMGHAPDETGVKFQPLPLQHGPKPGHIQLHRHGVAAGQLVAVIMKVFPAGPGGQINGVNCIGILPSFSFVLWGGLPCQAALPCPSCPKDVGQDAHQAPGQKADNAQENGRGHSFPSTARANRGARMGLKKRPGCRGWHWSFQWPAYEKRSPGRC